MIVNSRRDAKIPVANTAQGSPAHWRTRFVALFMVPIMVRFAVSSEHTLCNIRQDQTVSSCSQKKRPGPRPFGRTPGRDQLVLTSNDHRTYREGLAFGPHCGTGERGL